MKHFITLLSAVLFLSAAPIQAQTESIPGAGLYGTGQGFVWTGVGMISSAALLFANGALWDRTHPRDPDDPVITTPVYPALSLLEALLGAGVTLVGLPMSSIGKSRMARSGYTPEDLDTEGRRGFGVLLETGGFIHKYDFRFIAGSHLGEYVFVGGGTGASMAMHHGETTVIPSVFAASRFTFSARRVAPYAGLDLGVCRLDRALTDSARRAGLYGSYSAGARIRLNGKYALWLSSYLDLLDITDSQASSLGLRVSLSL